MQLSLCPATCRCVYMYDAAFTLLCHMHISLSCSLPAVVPYAYMVFNAAVLHVSVLLHGQQGTSMTHAAPSSSAGAGPTDVSPGALEAVERLEGSPPPENGLPQPLHPHHQEPQQGKQNSFILSSSSSIYGRSKNTLRQLNSPVSPK